MLFCIEAVGFEAHEIIFTSIGFKLKYLDCTYLACIYTAGLTSEHRFTLSSLDLWHFVSYSCIHVSLLLCCFFLLLSFTLTLLAALLY